MQATVIKSSGTKPSLRDHPHGQPKPIRPRSSITRRIVLLLVVALLFLVGALIFRTWQEAQQLIVTPTPERSARFGTMLSIDESIALMQGRISSNEQDHDAYAQLGLLLLQRVRSSGDAAEYARAEQALRAALALEPNQVDAMVGMGILSLALHDFGGALRWADEARSINPLRPDILGIMTDAHVEQGEYAEAVAVLQEMVDLRPGLNAYTRVAYVRELHGETDGAIEAMQSAAEMGVPGEEPTLWAIVQLGNLYFNRGDLAMAEQTYQVALAQLPDYIHAQGGMARVWAARGLYAEAIAQYRQLLTRIPLPEFAIALGELLEATGDARGAQEQYEVVELMQKLNASAGMNVDLEMALFESDHGDDHAAALAQAETVYAKRQNVYTADVLAWALYHNGRADEAQRYMDEALRLDTQDARLYYHAGMSAFAQGKNEDAHQLLTHALAINPYFSPLYAAEAKRVLAQLDEAR